MGQVDDHVKHVFREHNQEADHLANLGAEEQRKVTVEKEEQHRKLEGGTTILGRQRKERRKEWMWSYDQRC